LRIYNKIAEAVKSGDIEYWFDVWAEYVGPVTRVEWEVRHNNGGFEKLEDFDQLSELKIVELVNYLKKWGRLCLPNSRDRNRRRWELAPFWKKSF
jgi:hypothetical protein